MIITKLNESFVQIQGLKQELQEVKRMFSVKKPNAFFDPMIKRGLVPDSEVFYIENSDGLILPMGLVPFLKKFNVDISNIIGTPEYTKSEILEFIDSLNLPFELYDYQLNAVVDSILNKMQLCLSATGCLDPESKINVDLSQEAILALEEFRK